MPDETVFIFIYIFLVITGGVAIIASLVKIASKTPQHSGVSDSSVETIWFKFNAPAGFVYGLVAIFSVIFMVKYDHSFKYKEIINRLNQEVSIIKIENEELKTKLSINASDRGDSTFIVNVPSYAPLSLFNATVLIIYDHHVFSKSILEFKGIKGISFSKDGTYDQNQIEFEKGDRLFLKLDTDKIWGVNILNEASGVTLEFYDIYSHDKP